MVLFDLPGNLTLVTELLPVANDYTSGIVGIAILLIVLRVVL